MAEDKILKDQERLAKLWDAYEIQEKELELSIKKISTLEHKIKELNRVNDVLKKVVEDRDKEIRDLDLKVVSMEEQYSKYEPQIMELSRLYDEEKERYSKLFTITEELEEELAKAKRENEIKEKWFERNVGMLENLKESIVERNLQLREVELSSEKSKPEPMSLGAISAPEPKPEPETKTTFLEKLESESMAPSGAAEKTEEAFGGETRKASSEEKTVTFKKVAIQPEALSRPPATTGVTTISKEPLQDETALASKNETIYEFTKIPDVDPLIAETLFDAGFTSLNKLKTATTEDLAKIDGISPTVARKIRTNLFEMGQ